ncbi:MAG: adenosylhomocysteinase [Clostridiales Family XIII bacterium]|jgi:adenosylhomocysteinase|nr:adenosylhomocysteinase [Clostridiales Family XIII bacterium]
MPDYDIKDIALAPSGTQKINWVRDHMPILRGLEERYRDLPKEKKPLNGIRVSLCIHLEAKTAYLSLVLRHAGAEVSVAGSNVLSTQDDVCAGLVAAGISVFSVHGESGEDYEKHLENCLELKPHIVIDDGGDLVSLLHTKRKDLSEFVIGGCEETTTGIIRLKAMEAEGVLSFPMMAVNDAKCKHLFDNRYGTGQSVWDSIMRNTNLIIASKVCVVAGYGWCGKGVSMRAAALGGSVIVTEIDPVKAIEARMDGFSVMPMADAAPLGDIFVSVTGCRDVITLEHMKEMKDGALLANAGHFDVEVDVATLSAAAETHYEARKNIEAFVLSGGKRINILAEGRLVNIAAADGHPAEIMDMSFAVQFYSALYLKENHDTLGNRVVNVPNEIDDVIAREWLAANGIEVDTLTDVQEAYLNSWKI